MVVCRFSAASLFSFCLASLSALSCSSVSCNIVIRLSRLQNPIVIWDSSFKIGSNCVLIVATSSSTFFILDSTISGVVWFFVAILSLFISSLRFSISLLSEISSLV